MKLDRPEIRGLDDRGKALSVVGGGRALRCDGTVVRVAVINKAAGLDAAKQPGILRDFKLTPAHVRHLKDALEAFDATPQHAETRHSRRFVAAFVKDLEAEADSEKGLRLERRAWNACAFAERLASGGNAGVARQDHPAERLEHAAILKSLHHGAEVTLAGKDDFRRRGKLLRTSDRLSRTAQVPDGLEHRAHVPAAVVDEDDHGSVLSLQSITVDSRKVESQNDSLTARLRLSTVNFRLSTFNFL